MHPDRPAPPSLSAIAAVFLIIAMQSFGGGLSGWIRREVVQKRNWMGEQQFLSGLALCQIAPGPNAVNLSVFIGTTLRGTSGACAALGGMLGVPMIVVLALGAGFAAVSGAAVVGSVMAGIGAAAIGLNLATGLRMTRRGIRTPVGAAVAVAAAVSIGVLATDFLRTLLILLPVSLALAVWQSR
jgi:chromate transporter